MISQYFLGAVCIIGLFMIYKIGMWLYTPGKMNIWTKG